MSERKQFDPVDLWKKAYDDFEKRWDERLQAWTNSKRFVNLSRVGISAQSMFIESLRKSQERWLNEMNLPTRKDLANVSRIAIQTEDKVDALEEEVWGLSDAVAATRNQFAEMVEASKELLQSNRQLKQEITKLKNQLTVAQTQEPTDQLESLKAEVSELKHVIAELLKQQVSVEPGELVTATQTK